MLKRIILPIETISILEQYGDIDTVVNKILDLAEQELVPLFDLPPSSSNEIKVRKISVHIYNKWYINVILAGKFNISLRRMIQYFVDNELFNEFNWQIVKRDRDAIRVNISNAQTHLVNAAQIAYTNKNYELYSSLTKIVTSLSDISEDKYDDIL